MSASTDQIATLHPKLRDIALQAYNEAVQATPVGVHPIITQGYRTFDESNKLYQQGRTTSGEIVTNAKAGQSWHNYGLAVDFALVINGNAEWNQNDPNWMTVVNIFKNHGFNWGGDFPGTFKDYPHLENKMGQTLAELYNKYTEKDFIPGTEYVNI
jgi:peptidoglycan L-alanyl-D-glutamate endopeptidase CwlK